jgi:AraC-like DNA-binding protein
MSYSAAFLPELTHSAWVSSPVLRAVQYALVEQGISPDTHQAWRPLPKAAEAQVCWDECLDRLDAAMGLSPDPALGLRAGESATLAALHVVGHMLISCENLRSAIHAFLRFSPLVIRGAQFTLREEGDRATFSFTPPPCDERAARFCSELALSIAFGISRMFPPPPEPLPRLYWAEFCHADPGYLTRYEEVFGCTVRFDAGENALVFPARALDARYAYGDETLRDMLAHRAEALLSEQSGKASLSLRVKMHLRTCDLDATDAARVARAVGVTPSMLRRRLSQEGTTFSTLIDDVRRELALNALREPGSCIKVLSEQLGFSEPCAFHRAFRRWTGTTPAKYREEIRNAS